MRTVLILMLVLGLAAPLAHAKAKEKANKTKCSNALRQMAATAEQGIRKMQVRADHHLPTVMALLDAGQDADAAALAAQSVAQIDHHGHVTILKLQATADACLGALGADDQELIESLRKARGDLTALVEGARLRLDSFFDI